MRCCTVRIAAIASLVATTCAGCAGSWTPTFVAGSRKAEEETTHRGPGADDATTARIGSSLALAEGETLTPDQAFADVLGELRAIGAIDPAAERELLQELQDAKPEHYQLVVDQYRAALAYRKQLAQRDAERLERQRREAYEDAHLLLASKASQSGAAMTAAAADPTTAARSLVADMTLASDQEISPLRVATAPLPRRTQRVQLAGHDAEAASPLPPPPGVISAGHLAVSGDERATPAAYVSNSVSAPAAHRDWRTELDEAIATLQHATAEAPRSVDELHDHLRLRMLLMLADRDEDALAPIPGATPAQQDFWAKQLFALSAYLDAAGAADERARAAATLRHLDEARERLADLATLQVQNSTFVTQRVDGFGLYDPVAEAEFRPGEQIIVYAEVVNFRSRSTAEGYETTLGTSYEVVDESGRRVDGAQFPDVQDVCQSRRRDFHMQYEMQLPTRIYPGPYQLRIVITDHASNKIGQATLAFEIVDEPQR